MAMKLTNNMTVKCIFYENNEAEMKNELSSYDIGGSSMNLICRETKARSLFQFHCSHKNIFYCQVIGQFHRHVLYCIQ